MTFVQSTAHPVTSVCSCCNGYAMCGKPHKHQVVVLTAVAAANCQHHACCAAQPQDPLHCTFPRCFSAELRCLALSMHTLLCSSGSIYVAAQQTTQLASVGSIPSVSSTPKSCCLHALKIPASMRQEQRVMCCTPCYMQLRIQGTAAA